MKNKAQPTHDRILWQGLDLMSHFGLSGVTLGRLAERTAMSKSGLFAHFRSKEEVQISLLEQTGKVAGPIVMAPAMREPEGLPRLRAVVKNWFGWTSRAGLSGGCPVAAGMFELDDQEGPVRERLLEMERRWRDVLGGLVRQAMGRGELRADLDVDQFVWELCGIYLSHHASLRFVRDPHADERAERAFAALLERSGTRPAGSQTP